jgi:hypothetical protein
MDAAIMPLAELLKSLVRGTQQAIIAQQQRTFKQATIAEQKRDFESKIAHQQRQIEALTTGLQKVRAQVELHNPAPRTVVENR